MKKFAITLIFVIIASSFFSEADARHRRRWKRYSPRKHSPVSAPLDGGILSILAVAGVSYYLVKKKKAVTK